MSMNELYRELKIVSFKTTEYYKVFLEIYSRTQVGLSNFSICN